MFVKVYIYNNTIVYESEKMGNYLNVWLVQDYVNATMRWYIIQSLTVMLGERFMTRENIRQCSL